VLPDCSGTVPTARGPSSLPAIRWSVSSLSEITDQRGDGEADTQRRLEDQPRSRLEDSACGFGRPGVCPVSSVQMWCGLAQDLFLRLIDLERVGGDEETRTPDPLLAKEMLCQLSYVPSPSRECGGRFWTRTRDLCLIRAVL
jgi:hypothetical protein